MPWRPGTRGRRASVPAAAAAAGDGAYEELPYPGAAYPQTHPDRLATISTLFGGRPAAVEGCRVLELGCGDAGNLLPMAHALPGATFTGLDLSAGAIGRGKATLAQLGLDNVTLVTGDLARQDAGRLGRFDVVIAHGVFSWVPDPVREALLALTRACLEREGVAFVSFNALPGGHLRRVVREAMRWHARDATTASARVAAAREAAAALARRLAPGDVHLRTQVDHALARDDAGLIHDELAEPSDAFLVSDVAARAAGHGLRYMADAELHSGVDGASGELATELDALGGGRLEREQHLDLLTFRAFRQAVLVRDDSRAAGAPGARALGGLLAAAPLRAEPRRKGPRRFSGPGGRAITTDHPAVQQALEAIGGAWPRCVPVADLPGEAHDALLAGHLKGVVELRTWEPPIATDVAPRPLAPAPARLQAAAGQHVTNLRHETVDLTDDLGRRLLVLCDGTRDAEALAAELALTAKQRAGLRDQLQGLAERGLLEQARPAG